MIKKHIKCDVYLIVAEEPQVIPRLDDARLVQDTTEQIPHQSQMEAVRVHRRKLGGNPVNRNVPGQARIEGNETVT